MTVTTEASRSDRRGEARRWRQAREDAAGTATAEAEAQGRWQATAETDGGEETGKEENNGSPVEAREAGPEELFDSQCKMSFLSFCFWEQQTPFGGAFSFWSFLEKQKLPKASPNRAYITYSRHERNLPQILDCAAPIIQAD